MATVYKIHPAIGIARLGTSTETFPAPTIPGVPGNIDPSNGHTLPYRDNTAEKKLKAQAAQFWVYAHDTANPSAEPVLVEAGAGKPIERIEWTVHVANAKAFWFKFDGLKGERDVLNPPHYGYDPPPLSLRNDQPPFSDQPNRIKKWVIDPGPRSATAPATIGFNKNGSGGTYPETWPDPLLNGNAPNIETLGAMTVGTDFSLSVRGGSGRAGSTNGSDIVDYANNPGWFDDTADGSVSAKVVFADGTKTDAAGAWVIVGPPDFAPPLENIITLHDAIYDIGLRLCKLNTAIYDNGKFTAGFKPSFVDDVYPILHRAFTYRWVFKAGPTPSRQGFHATMDVSLLQGLSTPPSGTSDPNRGLRNVIFQRLRKPHDLNDERDTGKMPKLAGDKGDDLGLSLTETQYEVMSRWSKGQFDRGTGPIPPPPPSPSAPRTARGLDRAALQACVGGAFFPGIECSWTIREPKLYVAPFEFRFLHATQDPANGLKPGDVTKRSACPWQADFYLCKDHWWPAQRPDQVRESASSASRFVVWADGVNNFLDMVNKWDQLGLVDKALNAEEFFEVERHTSLGPHP